MFHGLSGQKIGIPPNGFGMFWVKSLYLAVHSKVAGVCGCSPPTFMEKVQILTHSQFDATKSVVPSGKLT